MDLPHDITNAVQGTGFNASDFSNEKEIRDYFTNENFTNMFGSEFELDYSLDNMANEAVEQWESQVFDGDDVTIEQLEVIASQYNYDSEDAKKAAIDKMNNNLFEETKLGDLHNIAKSLAV